jgi:hypothetical protein
MNPPNYTTKQFRDIRENLTLALAMTEQEAIDHLSDAWRRRNPQAQQGDPLGQQQPNPPAPQPVNPLPVQQQGGPPAQRQQTPPVQQQGDNQAPQNTATGARSQSPPTVGEKKKNHLKFRHGQTMTTFRRPDPSAHALKLLQEFKYVELWYFTHKGPEHCQKRPNRIHGEVQVARRKHPSLYGLLHVARHPQNQK